MNVDPVDPSGLLDEKTAPFTFRELVAADLILGLTEQGASASWRLAFEVTRRLWREAVVNRQDPDQAYEVTLQEGNLAALSMLSPDAAERVDRLRRGHRPALIDEWRRSLSGEELADRMRELEEQDAHWEEVKLEVGRIPRAGSDETAE